MGSFTRIRFSHILLDLAYTKLFRGAIPAHDSLVNEAIFRDDSTELIAYIRLRENNQPYMTPASCKQSKRIIRSYPKLLIMIQNIRLTMVLRDISDCSWNNVLRDQKYQKSAEGVSQVFHHFSFSFLKVTALGNTYSGNGARGVDYIMGWTPSASTTLCGLNFYLIPTMRSSSIW